MNLDIALCYDLKEEYLAAGFSELEVMEFDDEGVVAGLEGALRELGHRPERVGRGIELARRLVAGRRWDLVLSIAEGVAGRGREAQVPALCELFGQRYAFSDPVTCGVTLDKAWAKRIVAAAGVPTTPSLVVHSLADLEGCRLRGALFVKPLAEGSSKGVTGRSLVKKRGRLAGVCAELLAEHPTGLLVEPYLPGREVTVGVLGSNGDARVVGVMEVLYTERAEGIGYTAQNKDEWLANVRYRLVQGEALAETASRMALASYEALECRDAARVDLRCDAAGRPQFMEINPLPGLHPVRSDLPILSRLGGMAYRDLIGAIVDSAMTRSDPAVRPAERLALCTA